MPRVLTVFNGSPRWCESCFLGDDFNAKDLLVDSCSGSTEKLSNSSGGSFDQLELDADLADALPTPSPYTSAIFASLLIPADAEEGEEVRMKLEWPSVDVFLNDYNTIVIRQQVVATVQADGSVDVVLIEDEEISGPDSGDSSSTTTPIGTTARGEKIFFGTRGWPTGSGTAQFGMYVCTSDGEIKGLLNQQQAYDIEGPGDPPGYQGFTSPTPTLSTTMATTFQTIHRCYGA